MSESILRVECAYPPVSKTVRTIAVLIFVVVLTVVASNRGYDAAAIASILLAGATLLQAVMATVNTTPPLTPPAT